MDLRIYKSKLKSLNEVKHFLDQDRRFELVGKIEKEPQYNTYFELYMDSREKSLPQWIGEVEKLFDVNLDSHTPRQFNGIIIAQTSNSIFFVPKGYAFHIVEPISDLNFGMDIAERKISQGRIQLKASHFIQQNKMSEVSNFKRNLSNTPTASESIISITGKLTEADEQKFGRSIECGHALAIGKKFNVDKNDSVNNLNEFYNIFNEVDIALNQPIVAHYPRINYIERSSELEKELDGKLLDMLLNKKQEENVFFDVNRITLIGDRVNITRLDDKLALYIKNKPKTRKLIEIDDNSISAFVLENKDDIELLGDLKYSILENDGEDSKSLVNMPLKNFLFAEVALNDNIYLLSNGRWGYLTDSFFNYLELRLEQINQRVYFNNEFDAPESILNEKGKLTEDNYIKNLSKNDNIIELHKKFIKIDGTDIEIADIYNSGLNELFAIKIGTNTANSLYSFDQSILATHALRNAKDFKVRKSLKDLEDIALTSDIIDKIIDCRNMNVLWVADGSVKYVHDGVSNKNHNLNNFKSFLLKLKIIDWFDYAESNGFQAKIYFSKSLSSV